MRSTEPHSQIYIYESKNDKIVSRCTRETKHQIGMALCTVHLLDKVTADSYYTCSLFTVFHISDPASFSRVIDDKPFLASAWRMQPSLDKHS